MAIHEEFRWFYTNSPVASIRTDDVCFIDENTGWLVNSNGQICKTTDGGVNWVQQFFVSPRGPNKPYLRNIGFANADVGWAGALVGISQNDDDTDTNPLKDYRSSLLWHTTDGGTTWTVVDNLPVGSPQGACGLSVVNEQVVYASGTNNPKNIGPGILKTTDGGASWVCIDMSPYAMTLVDIHFVDANRGWVTGGRNAASCEGVIPPEYKDFPHYAPLLPVVLYTEDGGLTWTDQRQDPTSPCGEWGWKIFFLNETVGFISLGSLNKGAILKTLDGGQTWVRLPINDHRLLHGKEVSNINLEGVGFITEDFGWVGGWGTPPPWPFPGNYNSVTYDGGTQWFAEDHIPGDPNSDVRRAVNKYQFLNGADGIVGYCAGTRVYKYSPEPLPLPMVAEVLRFNLIASSDRLIGSIVFRFSIPAGARHAYLGVWNHFGWHVRDLLDEENPAAGLRTITWDGQDASGTFLNGSGYIARLCIDDDAESIFFGAPRTP